MTKIDLIATLASGLEYLDQDRMQWCCMAIDENGDWIEVGRYQDHRDPRFRSAASIEIWKRTVHGLPNPQETT